MDNEIYEKILREGKKTDWYGVNVPSELISPAVKLITSNIFEEIDKLESTLDELRGVGLDKRKKYIEALKKNIRNLPYTLNGDVYLKKKNRIESELELEKEKKGVVNTRKRKTVKKTTIDKKVVSNKTTTKNSNLIFGKNKK